MTTSAQSTPPSPSSGKGQPAATGPAVDPNLDVHLHGFWQKYGQSLVFVGAVVVLFYLGKAGWDAYQAKQEAGLQQEFGAAKTPDQLKSFAAAHPVHELAGVAYLEIADQAYAARQGSDAVSAYARAKDLLKGGPLGARAELGMAMAQVQAGQAVEGQATLHRLLDDAQQMAVVRAEAGYQLASLAAAAGHADEVQKIAMQLIQVDPNSPWAQRVFSLPGAIPTPAAAPPAAPSGISFKAAGQ